MIRKVYFSFLICFLTFGLNAQIRDYSTPISFQMGIKGSPPKITIPIMNFSQIQTQDSLDEVNGMIPKFARSQSVNYNPNNSGSWTNLSNGDKIWRLSIASSGAEALILYYKNFHLGKGAKLYLYNEDETQVLGAYTDQNNHSSQKFATEMIYGESVTIEYYEPAKMIERSWFEIEEVSHAYRYVQNPYKVSRNFGSSQNCEVNINCSPEGDNWQNQKRGVARILIKDGFSQGWCTGTVVNNARFDCTPYFLTALHCGETTSASDLNQWIFYFNYEASGCNNPGSEPGSNTMTGAARISDSNDGGGNSGSDFLLLRFNNSIPSNYNVHYVGWDAGGTAATSGVGIHHPAGDIKKISTYSSTLISTQWGSAAGSHWRVTWISTSNGHGVTEGGSSGSAIFDQNGRQVGTLTGGSSFCTSPNSPDQYGKMSYHWTSNGNPNNERLKPWLDPDNTGITQIDGVDFPCSPPVSDDAGITAIVVPNGNLCSTPFNPVVTLQNFGGNTLTSVTIRYRIDNGPYSTFAWTGSLAMGVSEDVTLPQMTTSFGAHTFDAYTQSPNGNTDGDNTNDASNSNFTLTNGTPYPIVEGFEGATFPPTGWSLINSDNLTTWVQRNNTVGPAGANTKVAFINHWNYNAVGQRDILETMVVSLNGASSPTMTFDVAYARYNDQYSDRLIVNISNDCGLTWTEVYNKSGKNADGNQLPTTTDKTTEWFPGTSNDWRNETIDLSAYIGMNIIVQFETENGYGNNLFLENINISDPVSCNLSASASSGSVSCNGGNDGTATVSTSGGSSPLQYLWDVSAGSQTTITATGLTAGSYNVTVTDINSCQATSSTVVNQPSAISLSTSSTQVSCSGGNNGTATVVASGGAGNFTYLWDSNAGNQNTSTATGLTVGTYSVTVTDISGCSQNTSASVTEPSVLTSSTSFSSPSCNGGNDGSATISAVGGAGSYTFLWDNNAANQTTSTATGLTAGGYDVTVTDVNGCAISDIVTINEPTSVSLTSAITHVLCNGDCDGAIDVTVSGGTPGYTYDWGFGPKTEDKSNLCVGSFTITVTDANNCTATLTSVVNSPAPLTASMSAVNSNCGNNDGSASANPSGGVTPYNYLWNDGNAQTTSTATGLSSGNYRVTVTDDNNCTTINSISVNDNSAVSTSVAGVDASCFGFCNGSASVTIVSGISPFSYSWSSGENTSSISNKCPAVYTVTTTDGNGCSDIQSVTIGAPSQIILNLSASDVLCNGGSSGSATVVASGGSGLYAFQWGTFSGNQTNPTAIGLSAGTHYVTVTDATLCVDSSSILVSEPTLLSSSVSISDALCNGSSDGSATVTGSGGSPSYSYLWDNNAGSQTTDYATGLSAGSFDVTLTDQNGCSVTSNAVINEPSGLSLSVSATDADCAGLNNGTATASVSGGTSPYNHQWDINTGFQTNATATALGPNYYVVTTWDNNNCSDTIGIRVNAPTPVVINMSMTQPSCNSNSDGSATGLPSGGSSPYSFLWNSAAASQTTSIASGLTAGSFTLSVTDNNGCLDSASITISQPAALSLSIDANDPLCNGDGNGDATVTPTGGTSPYTYQWGVTSASQTTQTAIALTSGNHYVTVTDVLGCLDSGNTLLNNPNAVAVNVTGSDPSCSGGADGDALATGSGGTGGYSYQWDASAMNQTTASATGLVAGNYNVTATDQNGCASSNNITLNDPSAVTTTTSSVNSNCNQPDGEASVLVSGGSTPYNILWDDPASQTTATATGLTTGTYNVSVSDNNGCQVVDVVTVGDNSGFSSTALGTGTTCNSVCDGSAVANGSGGLTPYTFNWSSGETTQSVAGKCAGSLSVTVTDDAGCISTNNVAIVQPAAMVLSFNSTDATCNGDSNGSLTVTVSGGTSGYSYQWDSSAMNQTNATATGLLNGNFGVTVTDANLCLANGTGFVNEPNTISSSTTSTNALCNGSPGGSATVSATGGNDGYTWLWDNNAGSQTSATATGLNAGTFFVTISDALGCQTTDSAVVTEPADMSISLTTTTVSCNSLSDGQASATVSDGTPFYSYLWEAATGSQTSSTATGLSAGTYALTVTDGNGCTKIDSVAVSEPTALTTSINGLNSTCSGDNNGTATALPSGGTTPYTYLWSGNTGFQNSQTATGLGSGYFTVSVDDGMGCRDTIGIRLTEPSLLALSTASTDASCSGASDGSISVIATGGTSPYQYAWDPAAGSQTNAVATGLSMGSYTVTVSDNNNCSNSITTSVNEPSALTITTNGLDPACSGDSNGSVVASSSGGTTPYTYSWDAGTGSQNTASATGLTSGTYYVTVTDNNSCTSSDSVTLTDPSGLSVSLTGTDVNCFGQNTGSVSASVTGGMTPYTYSWDNAASAQSTASVTGLPAGTYNLTVTDLNNCNIIDQATITEPSALNLITSSSNSNCNLADGSADVSVTGGTSPYGYLWNDPASQTNSSATGLNSGSYSVTVTDAVGCSSITNVSVLNNSGFTSTVNVTDVDCNGNCNGAATVVPSGGSTPYSYLWSTGETVSSISGRCAGSVSVTVTDAVGCIDNHTVTVVQPSALNLTLIPTGSTCNGSDDGNISSAVSGGTSGYNYIWDNNSGNQTATTATGLSPNTYSLTVTDNSGCSITDSAPVTEPTLMTVSTTGTNAVCGTGTGGAVSSTVSGGNSPYTYSWNDPLSQTTATATGLNNGYYEVTVSDFNGCVSTAGDSVTSPDSLMLSVSGVDASCGSNNGSASVVTSGGVSPYSFAWNDANAQTSFTATGLGNGNFNVTVTDQNGCSETAQVSIGNQGSNMIASITGTNASCDGICDGIADLSVSGGASPYSFNWNTGESSEDITGLCTNPYYVTVTDSLGCTATANVFIDEPKAILTSMASLPAGCQGSSTGAAQVTPSGGSGGYGYLWSTNANSVTTSYATALAADVYYVTVNDAMGCTTVDSVTITQSSPITVSTTSTPPACGFQNGMLTSSATGGSQPYSYQWNDSQSQATPNATGLFPGTYNVTITDVNGCSGIGTDTIGLDPAAIYMVEIMTPVCNGPDVTWEIANDSGTVVASGSIIRGDTVRWQVCDCGTTFTLNIPAGTTGPPSQRCNQKITPGGAYVYDASGNLLGFTDTDGGTIDVSNGSAGCSGSCPVLSTAFSSSDANCFNDPTGSASVLVSGGLSPYNYQWSTGGTTTSISNVIGGTYNLSITDQNGCPGFGSVTINSPSEIIPVFTILNPSCQNACDGSIDMNVSGGSGSPYTFNWSNGATTEDQSPLCFGIYDVTATDSNGCTGTGRATINPGPSPTYTVTANIPLCDGPDVSWWMLDDNGDTTSLGSLARGNQSSWDVCGCAAQLILSAPAGSSGSNPCSSSVSPGRVTVYDMFGNVIGNATQDGQVINVSGVGNCAVSCDALSGSVTSTDALCFGTATGTGAAVSNGASGNIAYQWSSGQSGSMVNLMAGTHVITATDDLSCQWTDTVNINEPTQIVATTSTNDASCGGVSDGDAQVSVSGGISPYNLLWSTGDTNTTVTGLAAGTYSIDLTDANGCFFSEIATVGQPPILNLSINSTNPLCNGECTGLIAAGASGGSGSYSFQWSSNANGQTTGVTTGLCAGTYEVTITDGIGCTDSDSVVLTEPVAMSLSTSGSVEYCQQQDGTVSAVLSNGNVPYSYIWDDQNNSTASGVGGLSAGTYTVTASDNNGCQLISSVVVGDSIGFSMNAAVLTGITCSGDADGQVMAVVNVPGTYTFQWDDPLGQTGNIATGLSSSIYNVTVSDPNGCSATSAVFLADPASIQVNYLQYSNVSCNGSCDGMFEIEGTNGTSPYTFDYGSGPDTNFFMGLCPVTMPVTVTDANGCFGNDTIVITEPASLALTVSGTDESAPGAVDGTASGSVSGGSSPYTYLWNNGATSASLSALSPGNYCLTVTDQNGCTINACVVVNTTGVNCTMSIDFAESQMTNCFGTTDGSATVTVGGAYGMPSYNWSSGASTSTALGLSAGNYGVTVTDSLGCFVDTVFAVTSPAELIISTSSTDAQNSNTPDGTATANTAGGTTPYTYSWSNGGTTMTVTGLSQGTYNVQVTDANGCVTTGFVVVSIWPVGVEHLSTNQGLSIYPNPVKNILRIENLEGGDIEQIEMYQSDGKLVLSNRGGSRSLNIQVSNLAVGVYYLSVQIESGIVRKMVVVQ